MQKTDRQDLVIYGCLGLSFLALVLFKGGSFLQGIDEQSLITGNAKQEKRDSQIAERRFGNCNTGIMMADGSPLLVEGGVVVDIRSQVPLAKGAVACDESGGTAVVGADGTATDIRVSARVRKAYLEQGFRIDNEINAARGQR